MCVSERARGRLIPNAEQKNMYLGGCKTEGWVCERELEEQCFFGFLSLVEQSGWGQRKGGRPRKWSRMLEGFRKCSGISGAGGEWWHERRTWQMQPTGTWKKKGLKLNGGIVSPFFALVPHTPHSFPHTHTHKLQSQHWAARFLAWFMMWMINAQFLFTAQTRKVQPLHSDEGVGGQHVVMREAGWVLASSHILYTLI